METNKNRMQKNIFLIYLKKSRKVYKQLKVVIPTTPNQLC